MVHVFYTSIPNETGKSMIAPMLNLLVGRNNWHIDLGDCDKVLRVESNLGHDYSMEIMAAIHDLGFACIPMTFSLN